MNACLMRTEHKQLKQDNYIHETISRRMGEKVEVTGNLSVKKKRSAVIFAISLLTAQTNDHKESNKE